MWGLIAVYFTGELCRLFLIKGRGNDILVEISNVTPIYNCIQMI
jgi:hypothetical protein